MSLHVLLWQIDTEAPGSAEQLGAIMGLVSGIVGTFLSAIYPSVVLFVMYRPSVIAAYQTPRT